MSLCGEIENIEFEIKQLLKTLEDKQAYLLRLKQIEKGEAMPIPFEDVIAQKSNREAIRELTKKPKIVVRNPVAKAMLQDRKPPQVVPAKKGSKVHYNRQQFKKEGKDTND